jgi:propanol-preferring alcohol dehydrogenase
VVALGASPDPVEASSGDLLFNSKKLVGALTGNPATGDATLKFSALSGVAPMVETMSLDERQRPTQGWQAARLGFESF